MDKRYKKFYEVGNNSYYTIVADGETYLATETFIPVQRRLKFMKPYKLMQGLKLIKFSTPIAILFQTILDSKPRKNQSLEYKDMIKYIKPKNRDIRAKIKDVYDIVNDEQIKKLDDWYKNIANEIRKSLKEKNDYTVDEYKKIMKVYDDRYKNSINIIKEHNPLNTTIDISDKEYTASKGVKSLIHNGLEHLYTEKVTAFCDNVYLYELDEFSTLTIYRVITVKGIIKTIDTFIYNKDIIKALFDSEYNKDVK